jgi:hypothetical protein
MRKRDVVLLNQFHWAFIHSHRVGNDSPLSVGEILPSGAVGKLGEVGDHCVEVSFGSYNYAANEVGPVWVGRFGGVVCDVDVEEFPDADELLELYMHFERFSLDLKGRESEEVEILRCNTSAPRSRYSVVLRLPYT